MMHFQILGPMQVNLDGRPIDIGSARKLRLMLAALLARAGQSTSIDLLTSALWGDTPPTSARRNIQLYAHQLRTALGPDRIVARTGGYGLAADSEIDAIRFRELAINGRDALEAGDFELAARTLRMALHLWQGNAYEEFLDCEQIADEAGRLQQLRVDTVTRWAEAEVNLGNCGGEVIGALADLTRDYPLRESPRAQLMLALYRAGRAAEALEVFHATRTTLNEQLGVEPTPALQRLHEAILRGDPSLELPAQPAIPKASSPAAPASIPVTLPADLPDFTGRLDALATLDSLANEGAATRMVVISAIRGTAGVGKTALAVHWGHRSATQRFPDGQLYLNLRGYDPRRPLQPIEALTSLLHSLGAEPERIPIDVEGASAMYRSMIAGRRMLVLLDNASTAEQVRPLLPGMPGCLVLVTSRDRLTGLVSRHGARHITLDVLTPDEAMTLMTRLLGRRRVEAEYEAAAALAAACGYLPLALRIAVATLAGWPDRSIAAHLADLTSGDRIAALSIDSEDDQPVRVAFDQSYATLTPEEQRLFYLLGLVPGTDFDAGAAAALADISTDVAGRLLDRLAGAYLVDPYSPGRYALHDLLRAYAVSHAQRQGAGMARDRLTGHYLAHAHAAARQLYPHLLRLPEPAEEPRPEFTDRTPALSWMETEVGNLVAAVVAHGELAEPRRAWQLADAMRGYFWLGRRTLAWLVTARAGLSAARAEADEQGQCAAQLSLGLAYLCLSDYAPATDHHKRALAHSQASNWLEGQAAALGGLGTIHLQQGELEQAATVYRRAIVINEQLGRAGARANNLSNLGLVQLDLGLLRPAADSFTQALDIQRATGSVTGEALAGGNLGEAYRLLGRHDEATEHLTASIALWRELGNPDHEAVCLHTLAAVRRDQGDLAEALSHADTALNLVRESGDRYSEAEILNTLGSVRHLLDDQIGASNDHQLALRLATDARMRYQEGDAHLGLANVSRRRGLLDDAFTHAHRSLAIASQVGYPILEAHARLSLAEVHAEAGNGSLADEFARVALKIFHEAGHYSGEAGALLLLDGRCDAGAQTYDHSGRASQVDVAETP